MSVAVERLDDAERWDALVEQSPHGTVFHRRGFLEVVADHADATLRPLAGFKGQEPVGLFPVFVVRKGPLTTAFSPPPDLKVSYGGPALLNHRGLSRRKAERRHRRFVEATLDRLVEDPGPTARLGPHYVHVRTGVRYDDPRPFEWRGFDASPGYTYEVPLDRDPADLFASFSGDARSNVRRARDAPVAVEASVGGRDAIPPVIEQVQARHDAQGEPYHVTPSFVVDLYDELGDDVVRPYVVTVDGEFAGGMVTLRDDAAVYRWQGGAKPDLDVPVNDYLDWQIVQDAAEAGRTRYDLVGANNRRLTGYKAKFAPELRTYASLERASTGMRSVARLYRWLR